MNQDEDYDVLFSAAADRDIKKLSRDIVRRIDPKILALAKNPRPVGCRKLAGVADTYRIRVGEYRIVYTVDDGRRRVTVTIVANRRESYRDL